MESNNQEESINSCEEVDQGDPQKNNLGMGRWYECVFCKRGFNTAQALGGHMNIHRRDKTRNKPSSTNTSQQEENQLGFRSSCNNQSIEHQSSLSYAADFPASRFGSRPLYGSHFLDDDLQRSSSDFDCNEKQHQNTLISDDRSLSLRSDYHPMVLDNLERKREGIMSQKEEVLDLELKLGYDS